MVEELTATHLFANAWDFFVERDGTKIERLIRKTETASQKIERLKEPSQN
jgi:hypothetical protein